MTNQLNREAHSGERNLFLLRTTRVKKGGPMLMLPGTETVLTVVSGEAALQSYVAEEKSNGPCRIWLARLGDIPEANFAELKFVTDFKIPQ